MWIKILLTASLLSSSLLASAQENGSKFTESALVLQTKTGQIFGTITTPLKFKKAPIAVFIAGSGPTDRDCNGPNIKSDAYKKLAHELAEHNIASLRYDKRGIAASKDAEKSESELRFEDYVNDAKEWIDLLKQDKRFSKIIVIGHSEGSLIGMLASTNADQFISIAGAGESADQLIKLQLSAQPEAVQDLCFPILDSLKAGKTVQNVNPMLNTLFRESVQPYLISWFKYDPAIEIQQLKIPILIIQGTNDIQVSMNDATQLSKASPKSKLVRIEKMNHIFRIVDGDKAANIKTYSDPTLPISSELVKSITRFIGKK